MIDLADLWRITILCHKLGFSQIGALAPILCAFLVDGGLTALAPFACRPEPRDLPVEAMRRTC
jgi:hypothetical protein